MLKKDFIEKIRKFDNPVIEELSKCGTLDEDSFAFVIYDKYKGQYSKGDFFYTNFLHRNKWSGKESYKDYIKRVDKFKIKINRWFNETIN